MSQTTPHAPSEGRTPNRLAGETSPYLLQHQYNPVDWYPWGPEAFERARREDRPLLLSVGYSACHWCHVMERESFEDPAIAGLMNERFVNIKVDREERPDVDSIYMQAVQSMTGHGGWPMTVFLTPDGVPFYGGTYFPPGDRHGMPGFPRVLQAVAEYYRDRRGEATQVGQELLDRLRQAERVRAGGDLLGPSVLDAAYQGLRAEFDARHGGLGRAPKFPQPMAFDFLLRYWRRRDVPDALRMVRETLTRMARGGIYDQLGGGFHRYSVDQVWLVPHFEKMLYDQAQLALLYLQAWQVTGDPEYRRVTEETLDYVVREMTHPEGGFYSTQDADSEGEEGKFFLWDPAEIESLLDPETARVALHYWGVADGANFEGRSILHVPRDPEEVAAALGLTPDKVSELLRRARAILFARREGRVKPGRDEKVLSGWNGMMLRAFAEASRALGTSRLPRDRPSGTPRSSCPPWSGTAGSSGPGRTAGRSSWGIWRTTRWWSTGSSRSTRRRSISGGSAQHAGWRARWWTSSGTRRRRGSSTPGGTTRPSSSGRGVSSTRRSPVARRWRPTSCFASRS